MRDVYQTGQARYSGRHSALVSYCTEAVRHVVLLTADVAHPPSKLAPAATFTMILTVSLFSFFFVPQPARMGDPICPCSPDHIIAFYLGSPGLLFFFHDTWMRAEACFLLQRRYVATADFFSSSSTWRQNFLIFVGFWLCFLAFRHRLAIDRRLSARSRIIVFFFIIIVIPSVFFFLGPTFSPA